MKRNTIFILLILSVFVGVKAQNTQATAVNVSGAENAYFNYANEQNTATFTNTYGRSTNDVWHKLVLTRAMEIVISHCGSTLSDTYMYLLNSSGTVIVSNDDCDGLVCENSYLSYIKRVLMPGTYYIVSEGYSSNGKILLTVRGNSSPNYLPHTNTGIKSENFTYTSTQNTDNSQNYYAGQSSKDVTYKLTLTRAMDITLSHCGSTLPDTYLHLGNVRKLILHL
ncbi:hypothetical protein AGMMS50262_24050 [Bacteroidia bacterium]|nr:hypothetical protein AGMMS50262_24050 [Bacteroidia bacterium]